MEEKKQGKSSETLAPSLESVYRSLDYFDRFNLDLQAWLNNAIQKQYGRDHELAYYDVTNYYFEIDEEDEFRRKGPSKEKRPNPIVQMGLLLDSKGLPLAFHLFPGNQSEKLSLNPIMNRVKEEYGLGRLVVVADKGLNCGDNIAYQIASVNGYIYSQSMRPASLYESLVIYIAAINIPVNINKAKKIIPRTVNSFIQFTILV